MDYLKENLIELTEKPTKNGVPSSSLFEHVALSYKLLAERGIFSEKDANIAVHFQFNGVDIYVDPTLSPAQIIKNYQHSFKSKKFTAG